FGLDVQGQLAGPGAFHALVAGGAGAAVCGGECHVDPRAAGVVGAVPPAPGGGPGCAGDLFTVPVDGEAGLVEPLPRGGLPAGVGLQRCDQGDAVFGAGGLDGFGIGIAGVDQMLGGGQGAGGEAGMDPGQGASVVHRAEGALGVGDEAGRVRVAGFGVVVFVAGPAHA